MIKILLILTFFSLHAYAQAPTPVPSPAESVSDICKEIQATRDSTSRQSHWRILLDILKLQLFPGKLVQLNSTEIPVDPDKRIRRAPVTPTQDSGLFQENIIFSLTPPEDILQSSDLLAMQFRYSELTRELKSLARQAAGIIAAPSLEACIQQTQESGFDFNAFMKLAEERNSLQVLEQIKDARVADRVIRRGLRHSRLEWQVIQTTDLMTLHQALMNNRVKNIVILSHGSSAGKLVDSRLTEYPLGFFEGISPSIHSITIFACHGEAIVKEYKIKEHLASLPSEHGVRKVFVSDGSVIAGMPELVPIRAFKSFIRKLDRELADDEANDEATEEEPVGPIAPPTTDCKLIVKGMTVLSGTLGFSLNGAFIGSANPGARDPAFTYPCEWRNRKQNVVVIHGYQILGRAAVELNNLNIIIFDTARPVVNSSLKNFFRADQSYQGSTFTFE